MIAQVSLEDILVKPMRVCEYCGVDISHRRAGARFCCQSHKTKVNGREYYTAHKKKIAVYLVTHRKKITAIVNELMPNVCFFDGCNCAHRKNCVNLILHEKKGNGHEREAADIIYKEPSYASEFVRLCFKHHSMVHALMDIGLTWDEITRLKY